MSRVKTDNKNLRRCLCLPLWISGAFILFVVTLFILPSCAPKRVQVPEVKPDRVITHRVLPGESWESISEDYYGTSDRAVELARFNQMKVSDKLRPGSGVRIPLRREDKRYLEHRARALKIYNEGTDLSSHGKYVKAIEKFNEALKIDPALVDARFNKAICFQKLGLHGKAEPILKELVRKYPSEQRYLFAYGNSLFYLGRLKEALSVFQKVLKQDPDHLKSLYAVAVVYEKLGEKGKAIDSWKKYLKKDIETEWADSAREHLKRLEGEGGGED